MGCDMVGYGGGVVVVVSAAAMVVVVVVEFFSNAGILGEDSTNHSHPFFLFVLLCSFF